MHLKKYKLEAHANESVFAVLHTHLSAEIDHKLIIDPATISASFVFILPVATGPNAIVLGLNQTIVHEMAREGLVSTSSVWPW